MNYLMSFLIGGLFCLVGQILIERTRLTPARILVGYVVTGVALSAVGVYKPLLEVAHSGASVPLTGFGHLLAEGVRTAIREKGFLGILTAFMLIIKAL
ncbi:MAG: SpoVA/SpoVAEb family sporulation membrane protein [Clostridia bacterium]|nr:SpoVA/SpoVAEb family sporulation membrane protein [Clostridia bacterium]